MPPKIYSLARFLPVEQDVLEKVPWNCSHFLRAVFNSLPVGGRIQGDAPCLFHPQGVPRDVVSSVRGRALNRANPHARNNLLESALVGELVLSNDGGYRALHPPES
jgi:hypothetical protein